MNDKIIDRKTKHGGFRSFLKKAASLGVAIEFFPSKKRVIKLTYKGEELFMNGDNVPVMRRMGNLTTDKEVTKMIFSASGIRTPKGIVAETFKQSVILIKKAGISYPVILKPTHGSRALGVTWNIASEKSLLEAFLYFKKIAAEHSLKKKTFLVEEMFVGHEYRVLVFNEKVISCVLKIPATIIGDGKSTIKKLVAAFNQERFPGFKIKIDSIVANTLKEKGLSLSSVLPRLFELRLRNNLNMSDGGRSIDVTDKIHHFFRDISIRATKIAGLTFGGVDIIVEDISVKTNKYVVLEINPNPYYNMNERPLVEGKGVDVSFLLLKQIFPKLKDRQSIIQKG